MGTKFIPSSSAQFREERRLRQIAEGLLITKTDTSKIEKLYAQFRDTCNNIRDLMRMDEFKGTYDEILSLPARGMDARLDDLVFKWQTLDSAIKVEANKLGYKGDQWVRNCWEAK